MATHFLDDREGGHAASGIASSCELTSDAPLAGGRQETTSARS